MSEPTTYFSWGEAARRLASEFDERLGSAAAEIVIFEANERAIAVGIAPAGGGTRTTFGRLFGEPAQGRRKRGAGLRGARGLVAVGSRARELAMVHRVIVLGQTRCVNRMSVLRGARAQVYAVHGLAAERAQKALLADMKAIAARLQETP